MSAARFRGHPSTSRLPRLEHTTGGRPWARVHVFAPLWRVGLSTFLLMDVRRHRGSAPVGRIGPVEPAQERRPGELAAHPAEHDPGLRRDAVENPPGDRNRSATAGLRPDLDRAGRLESARGEEGFRHRAAGHQQPVIAQHQDGLVADIRDQPQLFLGVDCDALVVVIVQAGQHEQRVPRDRQQPVALGRDRDAVLGVHMQHALRVLARGMHRDVDGEARRTHRIAVVEDDTAFEVDLDQARRRDLVERDATLWRRQNRDYQEIFIGTAARGRYLCSAMSVRPPSYSDTTRT